MSPSSELRGWRFRVHVNDRCVNRESMATDGCARNITSVAALHVDVDTVRKLRWGELDRRLAKANRLLLWLVERRSPSGRGWHRWIGVWPPPASAVETVALQLLCGSDPHREAYNLNRARQVDAGTVSDYWKVRWNVFYKRERSA